MRSFLRYKRIQYEWIQSNTYEAESLPPPTIPIIPAVYFENEKFSVGHTDSTPLIQTLNEICLQRTTIPPDPVLRFLNELLEDFSDEWLNKIMFYYRFNFDANRNAQFLLLATNPSMEEKVLNELSRVFEQRQVNRLSQIFDLNAKSMNFLETCYVNVLKLFDDILRENNYIFGSRPCSADFGFFGQFSQLVLTDPAPADIALHNTIRLRPWCELMEDLSGLDLSNAQWMTRDYIKSSESHKRLLQEVNDIYLPILNANFTALINNQNDFTVDLRGCLWKQNVNKYNAKCLRQLCKSYDILSYEDKMFIKSLGINFQGNKVVSSRL